MEPDNPTGLHDASITYFTEGNEAKYGWVLKHTGINIFDTKNKTFMVYKNDPQDLSSLSENQVNLFIRINWVIYDLNTVRRNKLGAKVRNKFIFYKTT